MPSPPDTTATTAPVDTTESVQQPASAVIAPEQPAAAAAPATEDRDDVHSGDEDSLADTTASISSSILNYRTIHGRTYHSERGNAQYWGSNDSRQNESMDLAHHALTLAIGGKLHLAPLGDKLKKVVDIGTGPGLWAIDFADEHPEAFVIGTDISPIQPGWIPPNLDQMEDCTTEWTFEPGTLDFVHMRYLTGSIVDWNQLFVEAFRSCRSGGYVESFEASPYMISDDETVLEGSAMDQWGKLFVEGSKTFGRTFTMVDDGLQRSGMEAAGFVDIDEYTVKSPIGRWPKDKKLKEVGRFAQATLEQDTEGWVSFMAATQGWTREEVLVYAARLRKEIRDPGIHGYFTIKVVWGRKP
ncbi:S-adenosyl-L-methionine-dependent methyltransferase [Sarocladium strictum]